MLEKSLIHTRLLKAAVIVLGLVFFLPASGWAQAVLGLSGVPTTGVKSGYTELLGPIQVIVSSGTTAAATLQVSVAPARIALPTSGIVLSGTGGLSGATLVSVVPDAGILIISIPAGATTGASLNLSGIRISVPSLNGATTVDARVSLTDNFFTANQNVTRVMSGVNDAFVVDAASDSSFTVSTNVLIDPLGAFTFSEGSVNGLTSDLGTLGQTQASQVVFQLVGLPDGVAVTFPQTITGSSGATLTAVSIEDVTSLATPAQKIYIFTDSVTGPTALETFTLTPTVTLLNGSGSGTVFLQVAEGPIAISPTSSANVIPRYAPQFVPAPSGGLINTRIMDFPISSTSNRVVVSNVATGAALLTVRARREDGSVINGADGTTFTLLSRQTVSLVPDSVFTGINLNTMRTLEVESQSRRVVGTSLEAAPGNSFSRPLLDEASTFYLPFDRKTTADVPVLSVLNGTEPTVVTFTLKSSTGQTVATSSRSLSQAGAVREAITNLLNQPPGGFGLTGYLVVSAAPVTSEGPPSKVRVSLINHPDSNAESVFGVATITQLSVPIPFFAFGGPYNTSLTLINGSATARARVRITPRQISGAPLAGTTAISREINASERLDLDLGQLFGTNLSPISVGYLVLDVDPVNTSSPFSGPPPVAGVVHIASGNPTTAFPVAFNPGTELFLTPTAEGGDSYTGLALLNAGSAATDVTIDLTGSDGISRGSTTFSIPAGASRLQLLRELFTNSIPHQDGTLRITSSLPVYVVGMRGSLVLSNLSYVQPQTAPQ